MAHTPLMQQYYDLKSEAGSALLFFRMGDFYELFDEDAKEASRILNITLTSRDKKSENPTPMAGIPHHALEGYLQKLLQAGKKVAIGEQLENPNETKGIVKRGIVRILTPAVQFNHEEEDSQYLVHIKKQNSKTYSFVALDPSTGESKVSPSLTEADLENQLQNQSIRHLLIEEENPEWISSIKNRTSLLIETLPSNYIHLKQAQKLLQDHYEMISLDSFIPEESIQLGLAKALLYTLKSQQIEKLPHLQLPTALESNDRLELGPQTARHLDLLPQPEGNPNLFQWMNHTGSALGSRYLKTLIQSPFKRCEDILIFQNAVREWSESPKRFEIGKKLFSKVYDLERILGRIHTGLANPRDTYALGQSLFILESLESILSDLETPLFLEVKTEIKELKADLHPLYQRILETQNDEAPLLARDGKIFKRGFSKELDHLIQLTENGEQWLIDLEKKERESTGISNLKVRYNRVFGYYIEVTKAHSSKVPERYQRKQTMVNAERFFTSELKKFEEEILSAESKRKSLELELFQELLEEIKAHSNSISTVAKLFGQIDTIQSLAHLSIRSGWTFPEIDQSLDLEIENGRHPLVDEALGGDYIPNSVTMQDQTALTWIITGPNMGGKSTLMRQVALIILLGQMGAPVPAKRARWGVFNSIFTRIGAHDAISKGQSTFMVEMNELAHLIQRSERRSLILLDEIGRGTSTYDGMSVAWSTLEWISQKIKARTFFATHYHELTKLVDSLPLIKNMHMGVESKSDKLRFLYTIEEGPANESFGIQVAQMAGLPKQLIKRAWSVLSHLESESTEQPSDSIHQLSLFEGTPSKEVEDTFEFQSIIDELESKDPNQMTPFEALQMISSLQKQIQEAQSEKEA